MPGKGSPTELSSPPHVINLKKEMSRPLRTVGGEMGGES